MRSEKKGIGEIAAEMHEIAKSKGWHDGSTLFGRGGQISGADAMRIGAWIALAHSELSEALEALREAKYKDELDIKLGDNGKPEGFIVEMADVVIRVFDTCEALGLDIESAIAVKARYNATRPIRHGGKKL